VSEVIFHIVRPESLFKVKLSSKRNDDTEGLDSLVPVPEVP